MRAYLYFVTVTSTIVLLGVFGWVTGAFLNYDQTIAVPFSAQSEASTEQDQLFQALAEELMQSELAAKQAKQDPWEEQQIRIKEVPDWPNGPHSGPLKKLKQVAGVAFSNDGTMLIFHRGDRAWTANIDIKKITTPILTDTVLIVNETNGDVLGSWGANLFYMPHGISTDRDGNVWLTDVATHQVYRFRKNYYHKPELVLGEKFVSGSDDKHFCMPTDVAVASNGFVYISDGYCNARIVIVAPDGMIMGQIGHKDGMVIPHSLALLDHEDLICVADRERMRILCYSAGLGTTKAGHLYFDIEHTSLKRVFAITNIGDMLVAINGPSLESQLQSKPEKDPPVGLVLDLATEHMITSFYPKQQFSEPHDVAYNPRSQSLIVMDLDSPRKLFKFHVYLKYN